MLVIHDRPEALAARLREGLVGCEVHYAATPDAVAPALERVRPEVVFSIKHSGFQGHFHRPAIDCDAVRWVQVGGSGYEHFAPWEKSRVTLTHCAGVLAPFLADTVLAAILAFNQQLLRYRAQQHARLWRPHTFRALSDLTLAVVGVGAIGGALATCASSLGMRVIGVRASGEAHPSVREMHPPEALHDVLSEADVVSVHLRRTPETEGLFDARAFAAMRRGAYFVNTSRGAIVNEPDLVDALRSGHLGGAYLDVFAHEPLGEDHPLWAMENVLVTPHASDNVEGWALRFADFFIANMARWRAGAPLVNVAR